MCLGQEERDGEERDREEEVYAEDPESVFTRRVSVFGWRGGEREESQWIVRWLDG